MKPVISIIIPIYNVERYLTQCLDSILQQDYLQWECILVDDGSKDRSGAICDEFLQRDKRFHVVHKTTKQIHSPFANTRPTLRAEETPPLVL